MKKPYINLRSLWHTITRRSAFQQGVDMPWVQQDTEPESPLPNSRSFAIPNLPLTARLEECDKRLEELKQLKSLKEGGEA